ncbi:Aste57867_14047 [Aphanomyces stellatus]|uniref:Aste57867_14047 protein n=1 Tax=Aphanomyces stellatus TaxID=120398 RepID=A0A485L0L7_9STRA|nr:hypothetical protein As57867_013996 [Aphanomyces stellatus]VFT90877.1 Aste57867_14047 [Aphanomyces stellatus]
MSAETIDVLIVGGGPTGLTVAAELVRQGIHSIVIIDLNADVVKQTKASVVWPRSLELLSVYDGVLDGILAHGERVTNIHMVSRTETLAAFNLSDHFESNFNFGALLEQWYTETVLASYLAKHGVHVRRSAELVAHTYIQDDVVDATVVVGKGTANETTTTYRAKYVLGCDGARSFVRKSIQSAFQGELLPYGFGSVHFTSSTPVACGSDQLRLCFYDNGIAFVTPMPGNSYLTAFDMTLEEDAKFCDPVKKDARGLPIQLDFTKDQIQTILRDRLMHVTIDEIRWQSHFRVNERLSEKYSDGKRIYLAGDACHAHTPLGGQGMNTGIQDAVNLGWKLAFVLKGAAKPSLLATYETERRLVGQELIVSTTTQQNMASNRTPLFQYLRNNAMRIFTQLNFVRELMAAKIGETVIAYRKSPLTAENWVKPAMVPYAWRRREQNFLRLFAARVTAGGRALDLDPQTPAVSTKGGGFKLLLFQGKNGHSITPLSSECLDEFGRAMVNQAKGVITDYVVVPTTDTASHTKYGVKAQCLFLVRPDGYVGLRSEPVCTHDVLSYLSQRVDISSVHYVGEFRPVAFDWVPYMIWTTAAVAAVAIGLAAVRKA